MKPIALLTLCTAAFAASGLTAAARETEAAPASRIDYTSFRIIAERNIFNANRSGRFSKPASREPERRIRTDTFTLLGTMSYEKGRFAFFDGSGSEFRKVLQPDESIAGFKIAEVAPTCVKLQTTNGQTLELCVGMQMKKREEEEWQLAGWPESSNTTSSASSSGQTSAGAGGDSDVLKRLMEQRAQENGAAPDAASPPTPPEPAKTEEPKDTGSGGEADEVLKRLLEKREQELNK